MGSLQDVHVHWDDSAWTHWRDYISWVVVEHVGIAQERKWSGLPVDTVSLATQTRIREMKQDKTSLTGRRFTLPGYSHCNVSGLICLFEEDRRFRARGKKNELIKEQKEPRRAGPLQSPHFLYHFVLILSAAYQQLFFFCQKCKEMAETHSWSIPFELGVHSVRRSGAAGGNKGAFSA